MNIDELIQPISPDAPCGVDLSFSAEFDRIQELRREDDPTLDQGEWVAENKVADWAGVVAQCDALLRQRSKDLRVAGWLTDACARTQGLQGLANGLTFVARLIEDRWDDLHPLADEGDFEPRIGTLRWLLARVEALARMVPVTSALHGRRLSLADIHAARLRQQAIAHGTLDVQTAKAEGVLLMEDAQRHITDSGMAAFETTLQQAHHVQQALLRLQAAVDAQLRDEAPGFVAARQAVEGAIDQWRRVGRDSGWGPAKLAGNAGNAGDAGDAGDATAGGDAGGSRGVEPHNPAGMSATSGSPNSIALPGPLRTRAQALQQLRDVASFFRHTEPHSPVAYLADKAALWGDMPLHAWLRAVLKDGGTLAQLEEMLGVEPPPGEAGHNG